MNGNFTAQAGNKTASKLAILVLPIVNDYLLGQLDQPAIPGS